MTLPSHSGSRPHRVRPWTFASLLFCAAMLASCAVVPPAGESSTEARDPDAFTVTGRLSVSYKDQAITTTFDWQHSVDTDLVDLSGPLGQTVARIKGSSKGNITLQATDGQIIEANSWRALAEKGLGWPLPVDGLIYWIRGSPRPDSPSAIDKDDLGRVERVRQDGWEIAYQRYSPTGRANLLRLTYPDIEMRIVIDGWRD